MFGGPYFGRGFFGGDDAQSLVGSVFSSTGTGSAAFDGSATAKSTVTAAGSSTASFAGAGVVGLFAMTGSGTFAPIPRPTFAMSGSGTFAPRGETPGAFKPEWAVNSNQRIGPRQARTH